MRYEVLVFPSLLGSPRYTNSYLRACYWYYFSGYPEARMIDTITKKEWVR